MFATPSWVRTSADKSLKQDLALDRPKHRDLLQIETGSDEALVTSVASFTMVKDGAQKRSRTADLLITNQLLYQLSYLGIRPRDLADQARACKDLPGEN